MSQNNNELIEWGKALQETTQWMAQDEGNGELGLNAESSLVELNAAINEATNGNLAKLLLIREQFDSPESRLEVEAIKHL